MSWQSIQSVGGLKFEIPYKDKNDKYFLPFKCNLSGCEEITVKPTQINSAPLYINKYKLKIKPKEIELFLYKTIGKNAGITEIKLGKIDPGTYQLYYIDENKIKTYIKEIDIK